MIRELTSEEKDFAKELIAYRDSDSSEKLQAVRLIRDKLSVLAIKYNKNTITLYAPAQTFTKIDVGDGVEFLGKNIAECVVERKNEVDKTWMYKLADILSTLQELEENRYITVSRFENPDRSLYKEFFNRNEYDKLIDEEFVDGKRKLPKLKLKDKDEYIKLLAQEFNGDIAELFNRYGTGMIFPLESLREWANHGFLTIEQRNANRDNKNVRIGIVVSIAIAIATSLFTTFCSPDAKIDKTQIENIDAAIKSIKTEYPTKIEVALPDTLTIRDIEKKNIINQIHVNE